ncbi:MAG: PKD domain-containing protein [Bacteroidia bacterium]
MYSWTPATGLSSASIANPTANPTSTTVYTVSVHRGTPACSATSQVTVTVNNPLPISISPAGPLTICPGESAALTASSGFTNYSWSLPGGGNASGANISATLIGSYTVTALGTNNCPATSSAVQIQAGNSAPIAVTADGPLSFCNGQDVLLTAQAGFNNYTWSNGAVGQSATISEAGTYFVTAEGGACGGISDNIVVSINNPAPLTVSPSGNVSACAGETVTLSAQAGFTNYTWSNNQIGQDLEVQNAGFYSVSATNTDGCIATSANVNVTYLPVFTVGITPNGVIDICDDLPVTLTAQAGFSNYEWSNSSQGATLVVSSSGLYSVSADNAQGCSGASNPVIVNFIDNQSASFTYEQNDIPIYNVQFTSTEVADEYLWDFGQGNTSTEESPSYAFPFDGVYPVTLTITNTCGSNSVTINVEVIKTSINDLSSFDNLIVNQLSSNSFLISGNANSNESLEISIINISGQELYSTKLNANGKFSEVVNLPSLAQGVYILRLNDSKSSVVRKWVR